MVLSPRGGGSAAGQGRSKLLPNREQRLAGGPEEAALDDLLGLGYLEVGGDVAQ
jgi:hypothetical protein